MASKGIPQPRAQQEVNLPFAPSESWSWPELDTERSTVFTPKDQRKAFYTKKPNYKSSFPGIKPQCPGLAWETKTGDAVDSN